MADCSSLNPLVLRITYDELVVLADELDNKKEKKHPKKKNHDKPQEKGDKCSKNEVEKRDTTDVSKNSNRKGERRKESEKGERNDKKEAKKEKKKGAESKEKHKSSSESTVSERESVTLDNKRKQKVKCGGQIQKKIVFNDNVDEYQDSELDLRARTGGVLKLSTTPLSAEDGHSTNSAKPRGIIKLPEGFDLNSHDTAEEKEELPCTSNEVVNSSEADDMFSRNRVQSKQVNTSNKLFDPDRAERLGVQENCHVKETKNNVQINEVSENECDKVQDISTENEQKQSPVEKRLKALNRQKAQKLMKLVTQTESSLNNLLSRDVLDKAAFQKIKTLSKEIQDLYKGILMLDLAFAVQKDVDQTLWKNGFYQVIETFRKYGKLFLGYADKKEVLSQEEINSCLKEFLESAHTFYKGLLESLQKTHQFSVQDVVNQPRKAEHLGKSVKLALLSSHHILICLGDIERYQAQFQPNHNWAAIRTWYLKASKLAPKDGKPYNQLAVVAVFAKRKLDAVYYYVRSLTVSNPILTAREKLMTIYYEIQKKADRIQRSEDEKRISLEQSRHNNAKGKGRGKGRSVFGEVAKGVGLMSEHNANHGRHEVWIFLLQESYRRVMLTENGQVQEVNLTGEPISEVTNKEPPTQTAKEPPKISLQEVNKMFVLHFLCAHGFLFSRIGMERLPALQYLLMGEFHTLLEYPACSAVSRSSLLQIMAINMFAIDNTAAQDSTEPYVRVGTPQDQALNLAVDMFICLLKCCCDLLRGQNTEGDTAPQTMEGLSAPLRQFLPAVKVFADWMICHVDLWQSSSISTHRNLWESMAQFVNAVAYLDIQNVLEESGDDMVTLWEDEFLAGFKLLIKANKPLCKVSSLDYKDLAEDNLRCQVFKDFAVFLVSLENPPLEFDADTGQFCAMIKSTPVSPAKESPSVTLHLDTASSQDHEDSDDDVIIESVEEEVDSGDEMEKDLKELKAKKDALKKQVEVHKERQDKAKAVINEHISKPRLMLENYPTYLVPDTNCFVDHMNGIRAIVACQAFTLVVPLIVINELDGLKRDFQVSKYNDLQHAQYVLDNARGAVDFLEFEFSRRNPQVKAVTSKGSELDTVAFRSEDPSGRKGKGCNDDIILSCCLHYCEENFVNRLATADQPITIQRKVVLLTDDRNLRVKAYIRNVPVLTVPQFRKMARL